MQTEPAAWVPRKLTPERTGRIVEAILAGARIDVAARRGQIAPSTHHDWVARGDAALTEVDGSLEQIEDEGKRACAEYATRIEEARREWELRQLALIQRAAQGQPWEETVVTEKVDADGRVVERTSVTKKGVKYAWSASAWLLERRLPEFYTRLSRTELTGAEGGPIEMSMEEAVERGRRAIDELAARRGRKVG